MQKKRLLRILKTGNEETFIVNQYIPLHLYNLAGDEVLVHFYAAPGLAHNSKVKILLGINVAVGLRKSYYNKNQSLPKDHSGNNCLVYEVS